VTDTLYESMGAPRDKARQSEQVNGLLTAIVSNSKDPQKLGRIKVKFLAREEENESDWAPVASLIGGKQRGAFFLPEVGDEVLVAFLNGNVDYPVIIGTLWSTEDKPPEQNADGKNNIKLYKSRAGHTVTFSDDSQGKKAKIEIKSSSGNTITLDDASGKEKVEIKDKTGKNKITMDATKKSIEIAGDMQINIKAKTINIEGETALNLKSKVLKIESSGIVEIKGNTVKIN